MAGKFNDVAALFDLQQIGDNLFRSPAPQGGANGRQIQRRRGAV
jgi:hypothetical protein